MNTISHDSETPAKGQQVISATAFIHHNFDGIEKVFLPRRAKTKKFLPEVFELSGGHIDYGEGIVEGLKREVMEEHGMNISVGDSFYVFTYTNEIKESHSIEVAFFAKFTDSIENIRINTEDHSEYRWYSEAELPEQNITELELLSIKKGFSLLKGESQNFG